MENEFKTVTNAKGLEIPKYFKDFKKLVEKDRQPAGFWISSKVKTCFINLSQGKKHETRQQKKSLAESLATEASDEI